MEKTLSQLSQFIPIVLTFVFLRYTNKSIEVSHTILGKLFAVSLILFYTRIDAILGLFVCLMVIYYYQTDYVEGMKDDIDGVDGAVDGAADSETKTKDTVSASSEKKKESLETEEFEEEGSEKAEPSKKESSKDSVPKESFANYETSYEPQVSAFKPELPEKKRFVQHHCEHHTLKYKNQPVRPDMADNIFSEISFNDTPCNICEKGCSFNIKQDELMRRFGGDTASYN
jgi:hypothetical protein